MINPLKKGDKVVVLAPSGRVNEAKIKKNIQLLLNWELEVSFGKHTFDQYNKLAGKDEDRLLDLQTALDDPTIKAIFCARGGYGLVRIVDDISWDTFKKHPKWIIGFSDITVLHNEVHNLGSPSIHAPMPNSYDTTPHEVLDKLHEALFTNDYQYPLSMLKQTPVIGGNLAIIYSLLGTNSDIDTRDKILFLEDIGEYAYNVDRMFRALKKAGKFDHIKALAIGYFTNIKDDNFGFTVEEIINEVTNEYNFPVVFGLKVGHEDENYPLILGRTYGA